MKRVFFIFLLLLTFFPEAGAADSGLREALKEYLSANSRWPEATIVIDNVEVAGEGLSIQGGKTFHITSRNKARATGRVSFNVTLMKGGRRVGKVVARADVRFLRSVVVAVRHIRMREQIGVDDVRLSEVDVSAIPATASFSLENVVGKAARRPISAGRVVRADYLQRPRMVKRGQSLDVRVEGGVIMVRSRATAISDGFLGSPIKARTSGGREISGMVSGPGQMVVKIR